MDGSDLSKLEIMRAQIEGEKRGLSIDFRVDDMRQLKTAPINYYGAVICLDNSLTHLDSDEEIFISLKAMRNRLRGGGTCLLSLRDYNKLMIERPPIVSPKFFQSGAYRRFVHQVWDWIDERRYVVHLYITYETDNGWKSHHSAGQYRAVSVEEMSSLVSKAGFTEVRILQPSETKYYQPIITAKN